MKIFIVDDHNMIREGLKTLLISMRRLGLCAVEAEQLFRRMKEFVEAVGQDKVEISTIIPDGTEPHAIS